MQNLFEINDITANIGDKQILGGLSLSMKPGEIHVIMGPNGSGKSTLANVLMGNPAYTQIAGSIILDSADITEMAPEDRATKGLFLAFQYPREISGVPLDNFLFTAYKSIQSKKTDEAKKMSVFAFRKKLKTEAAALSFKPEMLSRSINQGFSGGEKKKAEMLQMLLLDPKVAILDETDSGLDVDALKIVAKAISRFHSPDKSILLITHYQRILRYLPEYTLHVMVDGKIVATGDASLAEKLEKEGYAAYQS